MFIETVEKSFDEKKGLFVLNSKRNVIHFIGNLNSENVEERFYILLPAFCLINWSYPSIRWQTLLQ